MSNNNDAIANNEISPLKKVIDILDENGYRVLKAEKEPDDPRTYKGIINLRIFFAPKQEQRLEQTQLQSFKH